MLWAGTKLLGLWTGVLAVRQALSLATTFPSLVAVFSILRSLSEDVGGGSLSEADVVGVAASSGLANAIQLVGLSIVCWYLLSRTDRVVARLSRDVGGSDAV